MVNMAQLQQPVTVELKPNRDLLDPEFNGYKLSLETSQPRTTTLRNGLDIAQLTDDQYSLQHVKIFGTHNHVFNDPYNPFVVYYIDKTWSVERVSIDLRTGTLDANTDVWKIPKPTQNDNSGLRRFNISLSFPDKYYAVASDGCDALHFIKTGDRKSGLRWDRQSMMTLTPFQGKPCPEFTILDSRKYNCGNDVLIDVLMLRVNEASDWKETLDKLQDKSFATHNFVAVLEWITYQGSGDQPLKWEMKRHKTLLGHSSTDYAYLENEGTGVCIAGASKFHFVYDSEIPISFPGERVQTDAEKSKKCEYLWMQSMKEVKLWYRIPTGIRKEDVVVDFKKNSISISCKGRSVLEGPLVKTARVEGSYWIIDSPKCLPEEAPETETFEVSEAELNEKYKVLEIVLEKEVEGEVWVDTIVKGNTSGEQVVDQEFLEAIHSRLAHLCSDKWHADPGVSDAYDPRQLEECDEYPAESSCFMRFDRKSHQVTHLASLGSHQWLFNVRREAEIPPGICIRHDVDGIVWQPQLLSRPHSEPPFNPQTISWKMEHVGTFSALGYVQASKQQRKFTLCSPDMSYVAICDVAKHIYVYRQPIKIDSCLRNRRTGVHVTHVAKQLVLSLEAPHDILGVHATPSYLYVLTPQHFHAICILAEEE